MQNIENNYYVSFYKSGQKDLEIKNSQQTSWYTNGKKKTEGKMRYGRPQGEFKKYNEKGKLEVIEIWEDGKKIETIEKGNSLSFDR